VPYDNTAKEGAAKADVMANVRQRVEGRHRESGREAFLMCGWVDVRMGGCADGWMCGWVDVRNFSKLN